MIVSIGSEMQMGSRGLGGLGLPGEQSSTAGEKRRELGGNLRYIPQTSAG